MFTAQRLLVLLCASVFLLPTQIPYQPPADGIEEQVSPDPFPASLDEGPGPELAPEGKGGLDSATDPGHVKPLDGEWIMEPAPEPHICYFEPPRIYWVPIRKAPTGPEEVPDGGGGPGGITVPVPPAGGPGVPQGKAYVDVCFCLDTTGSMSDEIHVAKEAILDIAAAVKDGDPVPDVRYALVLYRDIGDAYVTLVHDFMSAQALEKVLRDVDAAQGGDYAESVSEGLHRAVHDVSWDLKRANCAIYLIGDAPPHLDYDNGFDYRGAAEAARDMGIVINSIGCSGIKGSEGQFREVSDITGGEFVYLSYGSESYDYGDDEEVPFPVRDVNATYRECEMECSVLACCMDGASYSRGASSDSDDEYENNLDQVLTGLIQAQANAQGVKYGDDDGG